MSEIKLKNQFQQVIQQDLTNRPLNLIHYF